MNLSFSCGLYQFWYEFLSLSIPSCFWYQIEERQKMVIEKESSGTSTPNYDPVNVVKEKALFLLKFAGLSKVHLKMEVSNIHLVELFVVVVS